MADGVTSMNDELLSICFRYVDGQKDIHEVFLQFLKLEPISQGLTSNNAEAKVMMQIPTCNQKNQEQNPIRLLQPIAALTTSTYHSPQHVNSL